MFERLKGLIGIGDISRLAGVETKDAWDGEPLKIQRPDPVMAQLDQWEPDNGKGES